MDTLIRLQKYLSECGVCSRRKAEELILAGHVCVNGHKAQLGDKVNPKRDHITVRGRKVALKKENTYLALYKPRGFVSTMSDENDRKCVAQLVADVGTRVYPVGRLDKDSEGLLLMTDDGELANALTHPSGHVEKVYRVKVDRPLTETHLQILTSPLVIDGYRIEPVKVEVQNITEEDSTLIMTLAEGRNRQIRKMCEQAGIGVKRLNRVSVGPVRLAGLPSGKWRRLEPKEVSALLKVTGLSTRRR